MNECSHSHVSIVTQAHRTLLFTYGTAFMIIVNEAFINEPWSLLFLEHGGVNSQIPEICP